MFYELEAYYEWHMMKICTNGLRLEGCTKHTVASGMLLYKKTKLRPPRVHVNAVILAMLIEKLTFNMRLAPSYYFDPGKRSFEIVAIGWAKTLTNLPVVRGIAQHGREQRLISCSEVEPGLHFMFPSCNANPDRAIRYNFRRLRLVSSNETVEVMDNGICSFNLTEINNQTGAHRGFRSVFAVGQIMALFERARRNQTLVDVDSIYNWIECNPYAWPRFAERDTLVVAWAYTCRDGMLKYDVTTSTFAKMMNICRSNEALASAAMNCI